nr:hypothetical protein [uncultured Rhodoferax sp.]
MTAKSLLLLPGLMCDAAVWAPQVQALSATHHCVVMDWGHMATLEQPKAVNAAFVRWLAA